MKSTQRKPVHQLGSNGLRAKVDTLATEEPLGIQVNGDPYAVTMRTPGQDVELALGFLVSEGVVNRHRLPHSAMLCPDDPGGNTVSVRFDPGSVGVTVAERSRPARLVSSACGVCGSGTLDDVAALAASATIDLALDEATWPIDTILRWPWLMREQQKNFARTGGVHAAALIAPDGSLLCVREDVGRHNAVDKVVGWAVVQELLPLRGHALQVSGRASFELVQKAWLAGIPLLSAVSAPSSLAVDLAQRAGMTLIGFNRGDNASVYAHPQRLQATTPH